MALFHAFNGPETSTLVRYVRGTAQRKWNTELLAL